VSAARRAARRERQAAALLGTTRVHRGRYESAPDLEPVVLPSGVRLLAEVKTRSALPALVTKALDQAAGYAAPGDVPAAVLSATGGEPVIVLPLRAFRRIAGLEPTPAAPLFDRTGSRAADVDPGRAIGTSDGPPVHRDPKRDPGPTSREHGTRPNDTPDLASTLRDLGPDERRVVAHLAARLLEGQRRYGRLSLALDARDWKAERAEEISDLLVYTAFESLKETVR
jgi:hypothetical protein